MCDCVDLLFCLVMGKNVIIGIIVYIRWLVDFFEIRLDRTCLIKWNCVLRIG